MEDWGERDPRWAGIRSEFTAVDGVRAHVLVADGPGHGTPQVLVHGLGGSATNWLEVMVELARFGPVVAPDLLGHGRTEPPYARAARVQGNARFLRSLCLTYGLDRIVLHGNSMGGLVASLVAARRPDLVERLVLVGPALPQRPGDLRSMPLGSLLRFAPFAIPGLGAWVTRQVWYRTPPERVAAETVELIWSQPSNARQALRDLALERARQSQELDWRIPGFAAAAESLVALLVGGRKINRALAAITAPTLVLWGCDDKLVSRAVIDQTRRARPDWSYEELEACGHCPQLEVPDRYIELVGAWLARTDISPGARTAAS